MTTSTGAQPDLEPSPPSAFPTNSSPQSAAPRRTRASRWASGLKRSLPACLAFALILLLWQLAVDHDIINSAAVASPTDIFDASRSALTTSVYWSAVLDTLHNWGLGLAISLLIAIPVGLILGSNSTIYVLTRFSVDFLRTIPAVAIIPLLLLLYGATHMMAIVLIVFGSLWPSLLQTMYGVHQVDPVARDVSKAYRFRPRDVVLRLVIPSAAPFIATGVRIAATMSLLLSIGAELIGGAPGIGAQIGLAQQDGRIDDLYLYVVTGAVFGVLLNVVLISTERKILRWHYRDHSNP